MDVLCMKCFFLRKGGDLSCLNSDALFFENMHPIVIEHLVSILSRSVACAGFCLIVNHGPAGV
jgi:hypothetical protein